ncbi:MAG: V-type ATP synthase subunit F [Oscillospiraceae bacterium]|nr:V-type ATP synthase subunit F [Oscillospiraceae bacterium]
MYKIAVMGAYDSIYGFAALGLATFPAETHEEGRTLLRELADNNYAIIYITEALAALLHDEIEKFASRITPAIILIPGVSGNTGDGITGVKKSVEQAVGSDILFSNH